MGVFLLPDSGDAASVTKAALAYTRGDRFKALDGHRTFTSHYHVEHTEAFLNTARFQQSTGVPDGLESPVFIKRFKDMNFDIVHLAELHLVPEAHDSPGDPRPLPKTFHTETPRLWEHAILR